MEPTPKTAESENELYLLLHDARFFLGFALHSIKRHRRLAVIVVVVIVALSVALLKILPPEFEVRARILAHPSGTLMEIRPFEGRASFPELIRSQENFERVAKELDLVTRSEKTKSVLGRAKDWVYLTLLNKKPNKDVLQKYMVYLLMRNVTVWNEENVITITARWRDAETAYLIAEKLVEHFLDDQFKQENTQYIVNIANAEKKLARSEENLEIAEKNYREIYRSEDIQEQIPTETRRRPALPPPTEPEASPSENDDAAVEERIQELERELSLKRREMEMLETTYMQRVGEAKNRLAELKLTMGPQHPEVIKAERLVKILSSPPPSIKRLSDEQARISADIAVARKQLGRGSNRSRPRARISSSSPSSLHTETHQEASENEDEAKFEEYMQARIARNTMAEELANARMQLEAAKSVLDYRYKVTLPPDMPEKPIKPNPKMILAAAVFGGLFLAFFLAILFDIKTGLILERWQVSRLLRIPVLGELDEP